MSKSPTRHVVKQADYDAIRKEAKDRAEVTVASNAEQAAQDKAEHDAKRQGPSLGHNEALAGAAAIEQRATERANAKAEQDRREQERREQERDSEIEQQHRG